MGATVEGTLEDFLVVNIDRRKYVIIRLKQHHLIEKIVKDLVQDNPKTPYKSTPAQTSKILHSYNQSERFNKSFHYRSLVVKLSYLYNFFRPYIAYATHHCARFSVNPKNQHAKALLHLGRYLKGNMNKGEIYLPKIDKGI